MSEKKQTAVTWLESQIDNNRMTEVPIWFWDLFEQAKELEQVEMQRFAKQCVLEDRKMLRSKGFFNYPMLPNIIIEPFYKQTYENE